MLLCRCFDKLIKSCGKICTAKPPTHCGKLGSTRRRHGNGCGETRFSGRRARITAHATELLGTPTRSCGAQICYPTSGLKPSSDELRTHWLRARFETICARTGR